MADLDLYDLVPYVSEPYSESHPDLHAAIARGFGLIPPEVDSARVLELGTSGGNNLIPIAAFIPGANCLGIDGSSRAIDSGRAKIAALGLKNIELRQARFEEPGELGEFDYIICHGVYSWVAPAARRLVLKIIAGHLAPNGVAYLSLNTFPGWHQRMPVRDLMRYYLNSAENITDPRQQIAEGRLVSAAMAEQTDRRDSIYRQTLNHAASQFSAMPDWYLFHDYLETENHPVYFSELIEEAKAAGLGYLADVVDNEVSIPEFAAELMRADKAAGAQTPRPREQQEQFYDFMVNRAFRRALFVGKEAAGAIRRTDLGPLERRKRYAATIPERPSVPPLVRCQAGEGSEITNYLHESIEISPFAAEVVKRMDGTLSAQQIADQIQAQGLGVKDDPKKTLLEVLETIDILQSMAVIMP